MKRLKFLLSIGQRMVSDMLTQQETLQAIQAIEKLIPNPQSDLQYDDPFHLLVAVILSAQTTDKAVNQIMPALMKTYGNSELMSKARPQDIEPYIQTIGLFRNKAKYLVKMSQQLQENFNGQVPHTRKELQSLSGVGRKTANVVLSVAFNQPAFAVDTHVERITKRLRMVPQDANPTQIEKIMMQKLPESWWIRAHQLLVLFGRYHSTASTKECAELIGMEDIVNASSINE